MDYCEFENFALSLKEASEAAIKLGEAWISWLDVLYNICPNKRVVHLAKYSKNPKVRKKNRRRIYHCKW